MKEISRIYKVSNNTQRGIKVLFTLQCIRTYNDDIHDNLWEHFLLKLYQVIHSCRSPYYGAVHQNQYGRFCRRCVNGSPIFFRIFIIHEYYLWRIITTKEKGNFFFGLGKKSS